MTPKPVTRDEFARRRHQLMRQMGRGAIAIVPVMPHRPRSGWSTFAIPKKGSISRSVRKLSPTAIGVVIAAASSAWAAISSG
jgi:hypothetical protein